jgi:glyoxylase-like metal-dependent hydrolase (beta-lactamase superfamily II)
VTTFARPEPRRGAPVDVAEAAPGIYRIDVFERGRPERAAAYVVDGGGVAALVETGARTSIDSLRGGLMALGMREESVRYIVVTHVHLDHAGAVGALAELWPWVRVVVHPRGARHVADPSRLEASARAVYGSRFDEYFGALVPVPQARVWAADDRARLAVGGRELIVLHTPGHAPHHIVLEDTATQGVFTGDSAGIIYPSLWPWGKATFHLPTTTPPSFEPEVMVESLERLLARDPRRLYFTHFGPAEPAEPFLRACIEEARTWGRLAMAETTPEGVRAALRRRMEERLRAEGIGDVAAAWRAADLEFDLDLDSQGLWAYAEGVRNAGR